METNQPKSRRGHLLSHYRIQFLSIGVIKRIYVESVFGDLAPAALALSAHLPELFWGSSITGEPAAHADNGNRNF